MMVNYTMFRDLSAVFTAANGLVSAGTTIGGQVDSRIESVKTGETLVLKKADDYGRGFWNDTYAASSDGGKGRNEAIFESAENLAKVINEIGPDVVRVCSALVGADAAHGINLYQATNTVQA